MPNPHRLLTLSSAVLGGFTGLSTAPAKTFALARLGHRR